MNGNELILLRKIEDLENYIKRVPEVGGVWQDWTPTFSASGSMTVDAVEVAEAKYTIVGKICFFMFRARLTLGGTASNLIYATAPVAIDDSNEYALNNCLLIDSALHNGLCLNLPATDTFQLSKADASNLVLGGGRQARASGFFQIA